MIGQDLHGGLPAGLMQQIMQMMQTQRQDPFSQGMPGEGLLGAGGMAPPQQGSAGGMMPQMPGLADAQMQGQQLIPNEQASTISTDFADTQPGLPNLPDSFGGFGFGQFAPKEVQPVGLRQQLIQQLMTNMGGSPMGGSAENSPMRPRFPGFGAVDLFGGGFK